MIEGMVWNKTKRIAFIVNIQINKNNRQQSSNEERVGEGFSIALVIVGGDDGKRLVIANLAKGIAKPWLF